MKLFQNILKLFSFKSKPKLEWNHISGKSFEEQQSELGAFQYTDDGFIYSRGDFSKDLKWSEITEINVYQKDLITFDEIRMEIVYGENSIEISEEIPGWYQFVLRTKEIFNSIPKNWDLEIVQPPFAINYKKIYSKIDTDKNVT